MNNLSDFKKVLEDKDLHWRSQEITAKKYTCGYCGSLVTSNKGMSIETMSRISANVYICTNCYLPTLIYENKSTYIESGTTKSNNIYEQIPGTKIGRQMKYVPEEINEIYEEARNCYSVEAFTAVILLCRKLLMHVAVHLGAKKNIGFAEYVDYLEEKNYITKQSRVWVDRIRKMGNDANHEIKSNSKSDARMIIKFCELLLLDNFEFLGDEKEFESNQNN